MGLAAWFSRRRGTAMSVGAVTAAATLVASLALASDGSPTAEVDLNDGGVWVTKTQALLLGHANPTAQLLDGAVLTDTGEFDVQQSGDAVLLTSAASATVVDPASMRLGQSVDIPGGAVVRLGGETVAVHDPAKGSVWVMPVGSFPSFSPSVAPTLRIGPRGDVVVGRDGTVHAVSAERDELISVAVSLSGPSSPETRPLRQPVGDDATITAVGATPVVFDRSSGVVQTPDIVQTLPDADSGVLQQPSGNASGVRISTRTALLTVPLSGGDPSVQDTKSQGEPTAPVWVAGCAYAAWNGSGEYIRDCAGEADDQHAEIDGVTAETRLTFRVNRDAVMLNDAAGGASWLVTGDLQQVDNWSDVTPPDGVSEDDSNSSQTTPDSAPPERTEENRPPVASDDDFGVRAGRTTILPVLDNDSDPDGDVLTAALVGSQPSLGDVRPIVNGTALQIETPVDASGSATFVYEIDDGRGGTAQATVTLRVVPDAENAAPVQKRVADVLVEAGASATYNVLPDWIDPDGDDVFLRSAAAQSGDEVTFTPDGRVTLRAITTTSGIVEVPIIVSDGRNEGAGTVRFDVRAPASTPPLTNADHVVVNRGTTATVAPLANDAAAGAEPLRLVQVGEAPGAEIVPDYPNKTFTFRSDTVGTVYVSYVVAAGATSASGLVRVDVVEPGTEDLAPIAVRDVALLPAGKDALVGVLANDVDPAGGVLVVQSITVPDGAGVSAAVVANESVRITDHGALDQQMRIGYTVSNGSQSAEGQIIVIPVPAPTELRPPVVVDDEATVRAGDVATIDVLANDYSPSASRLTLQPALVEPLPDPSAGEAFVSGDTVRFRAGAEAGTVTVSYEVADEAGQRESGRVIFRVLPADAPDNQAPRPRDVTARVIAGQASQVTIPLDGIDPDGDSVELVGLGSPPEKGRISAQTDTTLTYEAFADASGTDAFTYRVRDFLGAEATATVRVGVAAPETVHQPPYAVKDAVVVPPGRVVAVDVTANDAAADGGPVELLADGVEVPAVDGLAAKVVSPSLLEITVPDEPMETSVTYTIVDSRGLTAQAPVRVLVDASVPLSPPVARDDRVRVADMRKDGTVVVDVRANDTDVDGTVDALEVRSDDGAATVNADQTLTLRVEDERQVVGYTVTDADGLSGRAFVFVPARDELRPELRADVAPVRVRTGDTVRIPLADYVVAAGDARVQLAGDPSAVHSDGGSLVADSTTLSYTSATGYVGPDAITVPVTDGASADDPAGRRATVSIPITVTPADNVAPTFTDAQVSIGAGEPARTLELGPLTQDPDEGDLAAMKYELVGDPGGRITAALNGSRLRLSAPQDAAPGTSGSARIRISDGKADPVEGTVNVTVTTTTRPLAVANDDVVTDARAGSATVVDVLANDVNPYPETPLRLVGQPVVESGSGSAVAQGSSVAVTPDARFAGVMVVRYRVQDGSGQAERQVDGRIRLTVRGAPDAPGKPVAQSVASGAATLSWSAPSTNGTPITGYTVTAAGVNQACEATSCTITGLSNGQAYRFTVTATNAAGTSEPSPASDPVTPDERPGAPGTPSVSTGDGTADVRWGAASTNGSAIRQYTVEVTPAVGGETQRTVSGSTTSLPWAGLNNGTQYSFRVRAQNDAAEPSAWSASVTGVPAGVPSAPGAPSVTRQAAPGADVQVRASWNAPTNNGAAVEEYRVSVYRGGALLSTATTTSTSYTTAVAASTSPYTFAVEARNRIGWGPISAQSSGYRQVNAPGAPRDVVLTAGDARLTVQFTKGATNGAYDSEVAFEMELNGSGTWNPVTQGATVTATNGTAYTARVRAVTTIDGSRLESAPSANSNTVTPTAAVNDTLPKPKLSGPITYEPGAIVTWAWTMPPEDGFTIVDMYGTVTSQALGKESISLQQLQSGSARRGYDWNQWVTLEVTIEDNRGRVATETLTVQIPANPAG